MMVEAKLDSKALFWGALQHLYATIIPFIKCIHNTVNSHSSVYLQLVQFNVDFQLVNQLFFYLQVQYVTANILTLVSRLGGSSRHDPPSKSMALQQVHRYYLRIPDVNSRPGLCIYALHLLCLCEDTMSEYNLNNKMLFKNKTASQEDFSNAKLFSDFATFIAGVHIWTSRSTDVLNPFLLGWHHKPMHFVKMMLGPRNLNHNKIEWPI